MVDRATLRRALTAGLTAGVAMLYLCRGRARRGVRGPRGRHRLSDPGPADAVRPPAPGRVLDRWEGDRQLAAGSSPGWWPASRQASCSRIGFLVASALSPGIRDVLLRITPALLSFIAFGLDPLPGAVVNVAVATGLGLIGAGSRVLPGRILRPLVAGVGAVVLMSMIEPFLRPRLLDFGLIDLARWIYADHGLTVPATLVTFLIGAGIAAGWTAAPRDDATPAGRRRSGSAPARRVGRGPRPHRASSTPCRSSPAPS